MLGKLFNTCPNIEASRPSLRPRDQIEWVLNSENDMPWKPILVKYGNQIIIVKIDKQNGTRKLHAIENLVEDGFLVTTHARGYESPNDIETDSLTVINLTELTELLKPAI